MHSVNVLICTAVVLTGTIDVHAVLTAENFVAMRLIEDIYDRSDQPASRRSEGTIYRTGGITNDGDLFGDSVWDLDPESRNHSEQPARWLRSTGYEPEVVNGGMVHVGSSAVPGESYYGLHVSKVAGSDSLSVGDRRVKVVTAGGSAAGAYNVNNWHVYHYDIKNDVLTDLGPGMGLDANDNGLVVSAWNACCGSHGNGYYSKVLSIDSAQTNDEHEVASWRPTFGFNDPFPIAINNQNIIVGNVGSIFSGDRDPMKMVSTGDGTWSDPIKLETLAEGEGGRITGDATVIDISNNIDRPFGVGMIGRPQSHAVIWDINEGTIIADFGNRTLAWQISSDGTKVSGMRSEFSFPPRLLPTVWSTDDGWATFTELDLADALDSALDLEGANIWVELTDVDGVNDSGQVVGTGTYMDHAGIDQQGVFLLDTLPLGTMLSGDVNNDAEVNNLDITPFIAALAAADEAAFLTQFPDGNYAAADIDMSGSANNLDITPFIGLLTATGAAALPEPSSIACVMLILMMGQRRLVRR